MTGRDGPTPTPEGGRPRAAGRRRALAARVRASGAAAALAFTAVAAPAGAATRCDDPALLVRWPEDRPVWELCWHRPRDSSGPTGSGLELTDVRYRGLPVLDRAHVPVVWTEYGAGGEPGCAGRCLRTWTSEESRFAAGAEVVPGYHEPDPPAPPGAAASTAGTASLLWPLRTVCDRPAGAAAGDCPWGEPLACAAGVALERDDERLTLTTQLAAGWFRYAMSWSFHRNGTIEPRFGFARGSGACAASPVREHAVWRLDFALGGAERLLPGDGAPGWRVADPATDRGFAIIPGEGDLEPALHASAYDPDQLADPGLGCAFDAGALRPFAPASGSERSDLVLWYHAATEGTGTDCRLVGPTLTPFGTWPRLGEPIFEDGFESGHLGAWSLRRP